MAVQSIQQQQAVNTADKLRGLLLLKNRFVASCVQPLEAVCCCCQQRADAGRTNPTIIHIMHHVALTIIHATPPPCILDSTFTLPRNEE